MVFTRYSLSVVEFYRSGDTAHLLPNKLVRFVKTLTGRWEQLALMPKREHEDDQRKPAKANSANAQSAPTQQPSSLNSANQTQPQTPQAAPFNVFGDLRSPVCTPIVSAATPGFWGGFLQQLSQPPPPPSSSSPIKSTAACFMSNEQPTATKRMMLADKDENKAYVDLTEDIPEPAPGPSSCSQSTAPAPSPCLTKIAHVEEGEIVNDGDADAAIDIISAQFGRSHNVARRWSPSKLPRHADSDDAFAFSLCTYNILCQKTIGTTEYLYKHLKHSGQEAYLSWQHRWQRLSTELDLLKADVFCLQEVQIDHYQKQIQPFFDKRGYQSVYLKRTGPHVDGCATFWRAAKFDLVCERNVPYYVANGTALDRDNVGLITVLRPRHARARQHSLLVGNTHLLYNPRRGEIKLAQLALFFAHINQVRSQVSSAAGGECQLIVCGDFNMEPLCPLYRFVCAGSVKYSALKPDIVSGQLTHSSKTSNISATLLPASVPVVPATCEFMDDFVKRTKQTGGDALKKSTGVLAHELNLMSVYSHKAPKTSSHQKWGRGSHYSSKECSTLHSHGGGMVDYIWYGVRHKQLPQHLDLDNGQQLSQLTVSDVREGPLRCTRRLRLLGEQDMRRTCGPLPNACAGSDHVPLMACFEL